MGSMDGEIPAVWFLISSFGFMILSFIQFKKAGKSIETIFLSCLTILFLISYFILVFTSWFMNGTKFEIKVWKYLMKIPKGKVKTYKEVAIAIKCPKSARAVANACGKNPYAPKVPCHRVIRSDGKYGGFSSPGGTKLKIKMLKKEGFFL